MDVYEAIRGRLAVREFKPDPVPESTIRKVLLAARWAPSQRNRQPWHFIVVRDGETLKKIGAAASSGGYIANAPMAIAVVMDGAKQPQFDGGRAIENMILTAWSEGIGTCYVGSIDRDAVKSILGVPDHMELMTVMPFGFPTPEALKGGKRRKALHEIAHLERFGQPFG